MIGATISYYRIPQKLGAGSLSFCKAQDTRQGGFVALKLLPNDYPHHPLIPDRIQHKGRTAWTLNHTNGSTVAERE